MDDSLGIFRFHFAFQVTYHYLFPQLTMGLGLMLFLFRSHAWRTGSPVSERLARFWTRIFALNFAMGVVTGIPLEFAFGQGWPRFSERSGSIIGQTLAMEGLFSFFLESTFLGILLYGEKRLAKFWIWLATLMVFLGSWLSGWFIVATNAFMQHPVGHELAADGNFVLRDFGALFDNPWLLWQYPHVMLGSTLTACIVVASIGAFYLLLNRDREDAERMLRVAVPIGFVASLLLAFPTGDAKAKLVQQHQPATFAAMEGHFRTERGAPLALIGQPDVENMRLDNPIYVPKLLSFMTHQRWDAEVKGLEEFPRDEWPDQIPLLYFAYHVMVGLGTVFIGLLGFSTLAVLRKRLTRSQYLLWPLALLLPFPYIANTAGWMTSELGRQPWLIHGLMRTSEGHSAHISSGNAMFTLLGFMGLYLLLSILFLFLVWRILAQGPGAHGREEQLTTSRVEA
ncbi:MAG: cytochrome ubiquinol oxidase subunit I [Planctomycetota bacterium]|nr:MAG: cytochrome ubiquinol oxidase subunit I [Planctomycetota bacterium]